MVDLAQLKVRARTGTKYMFALRLMNGIVSFASVILLARLLPPRAFGLATMAGLILNFIAIFRDFGLTNATIQKRTISTEEMSSVFWFNAILTGCFALLSTLVSPLVADFYDQPIVRPVLWTLCLSFIISGISAQHAAILNREMRFAAIFISQASGLVGGLVAALVVALYTHDVWALVAMSITQTSIASFLIFMHVRWMPSITINLRRDVALIKFGVGTLIYSSLNFITNNISNIVIGYVHGPYSLGLYNRAYQVYSIPSNSIVQPAMQVMFPVFCRLRSHGNELAHAYLTLVARISLVLIPMAGMLPLLSADIVRMLLGESWADAAPVVAWFSPALAAVGMVAPFGQLMMSQGRLRELIWWGAVEVIIRGGGAAFGACFGPSGAAMGFSICTLTLAVPMIVWLIGRSGPVTARAQYRVIMPACPVALVAFGGALLGSIVSQGLNVSMPSRLAIELAFGIIAWVGSALLITPTRHTIIDFASAWGY